MCYADSTQQPSTCSSSKPASLPTHSPLDNLFPLSTFHISAQQLIYPPTA